MESNNWTGEEVVKWGKHQGKKWNELNMNTIEFYAKKFSPGPLQSCGEAELTRRNKALDNKEITISEWGQGI